MAIAARIVGGIFRVGYGGPAAPVQQRVIGGIVRSDRQVFGAGKITGTVAIKEDSASPAVPARRRVLCLDNRTRVIVRECWSALDGSFSFAGLIVGRSYLILADDNAEVYNDVVAARIEATVQ